MGFATVYPSIQLIKGCTFSVEGYYRVTPQNTYFMPCVSFVQVYVPGNTPSQELVTFLGRAF